MPLFHIELRILEERCQHIAQHPHFVKEPEHGHGRAGDALRNLKAAIAAFFAFTVVMPLRIGLSLVWKPVEDRLFALINGWEIERTLRAEYRKNFRTQFRTFGEFRRAYYGEEQKVGTKATGDNTAEAFALLGLKDTCTRAELEAQHRKLMKKLHPDVGGTDGLAAKINQAKDIIIKRKGWKK